MTIITADQQNDTESQLNKESLLTAHSQILMQL